MDFHRNITLAKARVDFGNFALSGLVGRELNGKTVGVWGTGEIGGIFCKIMLVRRFSMLRCVFTGVEIMGCTKPMRRLDW